MILGKGRNFSPCQDLRTSYSVYYPKITGALSFAVNLKRPKRKCTAEVSDARSFTSLMTSWYKVKVFRRIHAYVSYIVSAKQHHFDSSIIEKMADMQAYFVYLNKA
jgi:hypothetical protein